MSRSWFRRQEYAWFALRQFWAPKVKRELKTFTVSKSRWSVTQENVALDRIFTQAVSKIGYSLCG